MQVGDAEPHGEYTERLRARRAAHMRFETSFIRIGNVRLVVGGAAVVIGWLSFGSHLLSAAWLLLPAGVFLILMILHERVVSNQKIAYRAVQFYERGLARLEERWQGTGEAGERFRSPDHPYSEDLDLFGKGSLFQLMCSARTQAGEEILARWLRAPSTMAEVYSRHEAVRELRGRIDLREDLAVLGTEVRAGMNPEALARWSTDPPVRFSAQERYGAVLLAGAGVLSIVFFFVGKVPLSVPVVVLLLEFLFAYRLRPRVRHVIAGANAHARDLEILAEVLGRFEEESFDAARLVELRKELSVDGLQASHQIARLHRLMELLDSRLNQFFAPVASVLLWGTQFAMRIEDWRQSSGKHAGRWLAAIGELEAISSLASYQYEHPQDVFPELSAGPGPLFSAHGLAHPLIPADRAVRNDVHLDDWLRVLIVSGSNMSGKSTLLRSVGINAALAWAGAPVRARSLRLSSLSMGASIRGQDSLQDNRSRFYAEILRLKQVVSLAEGQTPLLFLLDELLSGTNSHDRRIGAEAIVKNLALNGGIGLVTTHDLALAHIAEALGDRAANVHFEDHLEGGEIRFDYVMKPGVVQRSNALALMRAVGLEV
jgi:hypothetical protein